MQHSCSRGKQNIGKAHIYLAQQLIEQLEQSIRDFRETQRFSGVVVGGGGGGGGGMLVFARRRPGALHPGLYRFSCIHMSSVFNISSDVSESYRAMFREHAVYARLEKNLHFSFVFKHFTSQRILH